MENSVQLELNGLAMSHAFFAPAPSLGLGGVIVNDAAAVEAPSIDR